MNLAYPFRSSNAGASHSFASTSSSRPAQCSCSACHTTSPSSSSTKSTYAIPCGSVVLISPRMRFAARFAAEPAPRIMSGAPYVHVWRMFDPPM